MAKPTSAKGRSYAFTQDRSFETAISLVRAETAARQAKVEQLRAVRLERDAAEAGLAAPPEKPKKKSSKNAKATGKPD
jgi:hypothetical protein